MQVEAMLEAASSSTPHLIRFGVFELDLRSGELRKAGARIPLQEQPRQILTVLLERPGDLITRSELHQRLWPSDTFVDFEHGLNAAVKRLRDTLGDSADTPRFIETIPRKGYRFVAPVLSSDAGERSHSPVLAPPPAGRHHQRVVWLTALVLVASVAAAGAWRWRALLAEGAGPPMKIVTLTALTGDEYSPSFSPDGEQIAFSWNGVDEDNFDIYVKMVDSADVRRLTSEPGFDGDPKWDPNGKRIAFVRQSPGASSGRIYMTSPIGGSQWKLSDFPVVNLDPARVSKISWSPDSQFLAASRTAEPAQPGGIYLVPVNGGNPRPLTQATAPAIHLSPAFSPDGRQLAYVSCTAFACHVYVLPLDAGFAPAGQPVQLTIHPTAIGKLTWIRNGRAVIYDAWAFGDTRLWRVASDGRTPPEQIEGAGTARLPATTMSSDRLAFTRASFDVDIYRFDPAGSSQPFLTSSLMDKSPQFSQDGTRIAFSSGRAGDTMEIWVAASNGDEAHRLTNGPGRQQGAPSWSLDGRQIVFESLADDGQFHLWVIDAAGGVPRQLTSGPGDQNKPVWSHDGHWIYFTADDGAGRDAWRMPAAGGPKAPVTHGGAGMQVWESRDGKMLFYSVGDALWTVPVTGGSARQVIPCVKAGAIALAASGIYYAACNDQFDLSTMLRKFDPDTGVDRVLGGLTDYWKELAVSPDEKMILYAKASNRGLHHRKFSIGADLMLIENFR
jgi:Tol biopolymer transport system component/DNA-binding winged helix-turn-helix (wHTH) protein